MAKKSNDDAFMIIEFIFKFIFEITIFFFKAIVWIFKSVFNQKPQRGKTSLNKDINYQSEDFNFKNFLRIGLESVYIIFHTNNWDILKSRIELIEKNIGFITDFNLTYNNNRLLIMDVVENYKRDYYDRPIDEMQIRIPFELDYNIRSTFYGDYITKSFHRYLKVQNDQIDNLKTGKAKENRKAKIKEISRNYSELLVRYGKLNPNYEQLLHEINNYKC